MFLVVPVRPTGVDTDHGDSRQPVPAGVADRLDDLGLVRDEHLGHEAATGPLLHPRVEPVDVDAGLQPPPAGERDRSSPPERHAGIDQPTGDQGRTVRVVGDRGDQPVVLVAEVGVESGPVAETPVVCPHPEGRGHRAVE